MDSLKRIFNGMDRQYMIRAYIFGGILFAITIGIAFNGKNTGIQAAEGIAFAAVSTILFPFAKLVWDQLKALALGNTILVMPIVFLYPAKLIVNGFLWSAAILIAPFGMGYIWLRTRMA